MQGITVTLYERSASSSSTDELNHTTYATRAVTVDNVLVAPMSDEEVLQMYTLTGRKAIYQLGIPKGDNHAWIAGSKVSFFGQDWRIIGLPQEGIEHLIPLSWNKKIRVERYEQA